METIIRLKSLGRWKETAIPVDTPTLLKYREICSREFKAYLDREKVTRGSLGFVQHTFTEFWLRKNGVELPKGLDQIILMYACYQNIQIMNEKGKWEILPLIYIWPKERG